MDTGFRRHDGIRNARHPGENRGPVLEGQKLPWIPAFAGMTHKKKAATP